MSITPMISPMVVSPRPQSTSPMSWQLNAAVPCTDPTASTVAVHGTTGFTGIYESKRLDPGSFAGGLT